MVQFISSNPVTDTMSANAMRDLDMARAEDQILTARSAREEKRLADENAGIAAGAMMNPPSALAQVAPASGSVTGPVESSAQPASALSTVAPDPYRNAITALQGRRGAGAMQLQLIAAQQAQAKEGQRRADEGMLELMKAIDEGNIERASQIDAHYNLGQGSVLSNPNSLTVVRRVVQSIPKNATAEQALAYQDAAVRKWSEVFKTTKDRNEADRAAGMAGMTAARNARSLDDDLKRAQIANEKRKTDKPVYPKIVKLKDENDREFLFDEHSGAVGRAVSATEDMPAKSNWFSPDEPAVPGTAAGVEWTASDGRKLPGGIASIYSGIKQPEPAPVERLVIAPDGKKIPESQVQAYAEYLKAQPSASVQPTADKPATQIPRETYQEGIARQRRVQEEYRARKDAEEEVKKASEKASRDAKKSRLEAELAKWQSSNPNPAKGSNADNRIEGLKYTIANWKY